MNCDYPPGSIVCNVEASTVIALVSLVVSIIALWRNARLSKRNINLSIQQSIFKMVQEKARDCNVAWKNEPANEMNDSSPHFLIATELIVAIDVINKAFELFGENDESISKKKSLYYYLYWKQLIPDVRGWVMERTKDISREINSEVYTKQIQLMHSTFRKYFDS